MFIVKKGFRHYFTKYCSVSLWKVLAWILNWPLDSLTQPIHYLWTKSLYSFHFANAAKYRYICSSLFYGFKWNLMHNCCFLVFVVILKGLKGIWCLERYWKQTSCQYASSEISQIFLKCNIAPIEKGQRSSIDEFYLHLWCYENMLSLKFGIKRCKIGKVNTWRVSKFSSPNSTG